MKKGLFALISILAVTGCSDEVGEVSLGLFTTKDVKIEAFTDPKISGVTCHVAHVEANLSLADPSDMSIACRQTGPITAQQLATIDHSKGGEVIFSESKSIFFKSMNIRRIYDAKYQTLLYLSYSTKQINGSHKHSLSTVPLFGSAAWQEPIAK